MPVIEVHRNGWWRSDADLFLVAIDTLIDARIFQTEPCRTLAGPVAQGLAPLNGIQADPGAIVVGNPVDWPDGTRRWIGAACFEQLDEREIATFIAHWNGLGCLRSVMPRRFAELAMPTFRSLERLYYGLIAEAFECSQSGLLILSTQE